MTIPYKKIVLWYKVVFTLLCFNFLSLYFDWYSFTAVMYWIVGVVYFYTLFRLDWKAPISGRMVFILKAISETIIVIWYILLFFGSLLGIESNYTVASGKGYRVRQEGVFISSYCVLYHYLYLVERPLADYKGPHELFSRYGEITNAVKDHGSLRLNIRWGSSTNEYTFEKL